MIKGLIQQNNIAVVNKYALNTGAPQYTGQMLTIIKQEINSNTITVGTLTDHLTPKDRSSRQKN